MTSTALRAGSRVLIVLTCGPEAPHRAPGPFLFAAEAAKMGCETSLCFVLQAPLLLKRGVAEGLTAKPGGRPISEFIADALAAGAEFYVCDAALQLCDMTPEDLVDEIENLVGPSFLIVRGLEADLTLSF